MHYINAKYHIWKYLARVVSSCQVPIMTSSLAKQLKTIQQKDRLVRGVPAGQKKRPSFLFDEKEAADYDDETIYSLGFDGFTELCKEDPTLRSYQDRIFNPHLIGTDLSLSTRRELNEWEKEVSIFLILLCPHFQKKAAHKVMEWMVRKWRVNETNVDALMVSILPHAETTAFVRMVQTVYFTADSRWSFLYERVKQNGSSITRRFVAQRCNVDSTILGRILSGFSDLREHVKKNEEYKFSSCFISFVTFLMMEICLDTKKVKEFEPIQFFQRLEVLLAAKECPEAVLGSAMIFVNFYERTPLSQTALAYFLRRLIMNCSPSIEYQVLLVAFRTIEYGFLKHLPSEIAIPIGTMAASHHMILSKYEPRVFLSALTKTLSELEVAEACDILKRIQALFCLEGSK